MRHYAESEGKMVEVHILVALWVFLFSYHPSILRTFLTYQDYGLTSTQSGSEQVSQTS
jgi:hypothetical protein